jgi:DNA-binding FrmR family transcriptional regulator
MCVNNNSYYKRCAYVHIWLYAGCRIWRQVCQKKKCCCGKKKERTDSEKKLLLNRLKRIEGQIRGIYGMVENDAYCIDILNQAQAANAALTAFDKALLANHIKTCVVDDIKNGDDEVVDELVMTLQKFMK